MVTVGLRVCCGAGDRLAGTGWELFSFKVKRENSLNIAARMKAWREKTQREEEERNKTERKEGKKIQIIDSLKANCLHISPLGCDQL